MNAAFSTASGARAHASTVLENTASPNPEKQP